MFIKIFIMKRLFFIAGIAFIFCSLQVAGQLKDPGDIIKDPFDPPIIILPTIDEVKYEYDAAGNRKIRKVIQVAPITPDDDDEDLETDGDDDDEIESKSASFNAKPETGGETLSGEREIHVYPNPVREAVTVDIRNGDEDDNYIMMFFDSSGKLLMERPRSGNGIEQVDMTAFPNGIYILSVRMGKSKKEFRVIKN